MTKPKKNFHRLALEHWTWLDSVLETIHEKDRVLNGKLYMDAFIHGYGHGQEDRKKEEKHRESHSRQS